MQNKRFNQNLLTFINWKSTCMAKIALGG